MDPCDRILLVAIAVVVAAAVHSWQLTKANQRLVDQVLMLKGMAPHLVDPKTFTPSGASWDVHKEVLAAEERMRQSNVDPPGIDEAEATEQQAAVRRLKRDGYTVAEEFFARAAQRADEVDRATSFPTAGPA